MIGKLFLSGGGSEKKTFEFDEIFLKEINKIIYIPLAWPNENFEGCLNWFTSMINTHKKGISIKMLTNLNEKINLSDFDAIYIGGGNTFKLLKKIKDSEFDKKLKEYYENGGIIYGGSAGALILGNKIDLALISKEKDENIVGLKNTSGLNLIKDYDIQCHFEPNQINKHLEFIKNSKRKIIAIPEESGLIVKDNKLEVIGSAPITTITPEKICIWNPKEYVL